MSGVSNERQFSMIPNGDGIFDSQQIRPEDFTESSANASIAATYSGGDSLTALIFNASASTSDVAKTRLVLPPTFKKHVDANSPAKLLCTLYAASISQNATAVNDDLELDIKVVIKPGPRAASRAEIVVDYLGCPLGATVSADPPVNYPSAFTFDVLKGLTAAQKAYVVPGSIVELWIRPNETVGTNVALAVTGGTWSFLRHIKYAVPTLTTLA